MKKVLAVLTVFVFSGFSYAAEHDHSSHEEMMKKAGAGQDDGRVQLNLPEEMKTMQKAMMREHMDTLGAIAAALAENDLKKAARVSRDNLGWSEEEEKRCEKVSRIAGQKDFKELGMAVHKKADELADYAGKGSKDRALAAFSELINNCNACHKRFKH